VFARSTTYTNEPQCYTYTAYLVYMFFQGFTYVILPVLVAARSKAYVCGRLPAKTGFESHRGHGCLSLVSVVCCQVEVSVTG